MTRRIANADELVQALRSLQNDSFPNGAVIKFREIDYALLPLIEQIKADLEIDVMVRRVNTLFNAVHIVLLTGWGSTIYTRWESTGPG
jgi:hypothetical protein